MEKKANRWLTLEGPTATQAIDGQTARGEGRTNSRRTAELGRRRSVDGGAGGAVKTARGAGGLYETLRLVSSSK